MFRKPRFAIWAGVAASALTMVMTGAPTVIRAADHLDAATSFTAPDNRRDADINDVYVFRSPENPSRTVLIMTTHPGLGVITTDPSYGTDIRYDIMVRRAGTDFVTRYSLLFRPLPIGGQFYYVYREQGANRAPIGQGFTNGQGTLQNGRVFVGRVSDPFFFDLEAFNNTVQGRLDQRILPLNLHGERGTQVCQSTTGARDFFANLNTNAIVLEVPSADLGTNVAIWARTMRTSIPVFDGPQVDRMARPAINTVFNGRKALLNTGDNADKDIFNRIVNPTLDPSTRTTSGGTFRDNVLNVLRAFDSLATTLAGIPPRSETTRQGLASALLPDTLPFNTNNPVTDGVFNGRRLADDVIDLELGVTTNNLVTTDCVGPHSDYRQTFPYVGLPH